MKKQNTMTAGSAPAPSSAAPPSTAPAAPAVAAPPPARRPRRKPFDAVILLVFAAILIYAVYRYRFEIGGALYSSAALAIFVIMIVEFLILKSMDRTRLYRMENERLVRRRAEDLKAMREGEAALAAILNVKPYSASARWPGAYSASSMIASPPTAAADEKGAAGANGDSAAPGEPPLDSFPLTPLPGPAGLEAMEAAEAKTAGSEAAGGDTLESAHKAMQRLRSRLQ